MLEVDVYIERGKTTAEVVDAVTSEMQDEEDDVEMLTDVTQQSDVCIDSLRSIRCWRKTGTSSTFSCDTRHVNMQTSCSLHVQFEQGGPRRTGWAKLNEANAVSFVVVKRVLQNFDNFYRASAH